MTYLDKRYCRRWSLALGLGIVLFGAQSILTSAPVTTTIYLSGHSRADAVAWGFKADSGRNSGFWTNIAVPSCWEQEGFGIYRYGQDPPPPSVHATYRRMFKVPSLGDRCARLCFEGVMTDAEVFVNGQSAGPIHRGGFSPFSFDVTSLLQPGANVLEVRVRENSSNPAIQKAERYADFWMFGGIHRPVFVELLPREHIGRIAVDARADGQLHAQAFLSAVAPHTVLSAVLRDTRGRPFGPRLCVPVTNSSPIITGRFTAPTLWSLEEPALYELEVTLSRDQKPLHRIRQRIGFRTFEIVESGGFRLNGRRILLKGVCRAAFRPETGRSLSPEDSVADVRLLKAMNANAVRAGHYPADRHFLEACDELGLLVVSEVLAWSSPLPDIEGAQLVREMVCRDQNHPCIVFWGNGNHMAFNPRLEEVFHETDLQRRRALRMEPRNAALPQPATPGLLPVDTRFYPTYNELTNWLAQGCHPVLPLETLHALYDGGGGASLSAYLAALERSPVGGGLFLWEMVDEAVKRTDQRGGLDPSGNRSCDGLVGPHHQKEASYYAARDIFSPVQIAPCTAEEILASGLVTVHNGFHSVSLQEVRFIRQLGKLTATRSGPTAVQAYARRLKSPAAAPGETVELDLLIPPNPARYDFVLLKALWPDGRLIREWSWPLRNRTSYAPAPSGGHIEATETGSRINIRADGKDFVFEVATGRLMEARSGGTRLLLSNGPDLAWAAPAGSVLPIEFRDGVARNIPAMTEAVVKGAGEMNRSDFVPGRLANPAAGAPSARLVRMPDRCEIIVQENRGFTSLKWTVFADATLRLDYSYSLTGTFDSHGISFDLAAKAQNVSWLGDGPHPVWRNRLEGVAFGWHQKVDLATQPGKRWAYPVFAGCHANTFWFELREGAQKMQVWILSQGITPRWLTPDWGATPVNAQAALPPGDLSFLHAIPPIGEKWHPARDLGPSSAPEKADGDCGGTLLFRFSKGIQ